jgi:hypothetical protein
MWSLPVITRTMLTRLPQPGARRLKANIMAPATDRIAVLLSLFNSGYDLTLTHSTSTGDAKGLRQSLQLGKQLRLQVLRT